MKNIIAIIIFLALPLASKANSLTSIIQLSGIEDTLNKTNSLVIEDNLTKNPSLLPYKEVMNEFFEKNVSFNIFEPKIEEIYYSRFSKEELKIIQARIKSVSSKQDLILFYGSSIGQKLLDMFSEIEETVLTEAAVKVSDPNYGVGAAIKRAHECKLSKEKC